MVLSSPSEVMSCTELSRPTVSGSTACGNRTVSRTGNTGYDCSVCGDAASALPSILRVWSAIWLSFRDMDEVSHLTDANAGSTHLQRGSDCTCVTPPGPALNSYYSSAE